jgi:hypothetical protein
MTTVLSDNNTYEQKFIGSMDYFIFRLFWKSLAFNIEVDNRWYHLIKKNNEHTYELGTIKERSDGLLFFYSLFHVELYNHLEQEEPIGLGHFKKCMDGQEDFKIAVEWYERNEYGEKIAKTVYSYLADELKLKIDFNYI